MSSEIAQVGLCCFIVFSLLGIGVFYLLADLRREFRTLNGNMEKLRRVIWRAGASKKPPDADVGEDFVPLSLFQYPEELNELLNYNGKIKKK